MLRVLALLLCAVALALSAPGAALAQNNPFGPVPTETPEVENTGADDVSRTTLYLIAAGVLVGVVTIGVLISRDARRSLTQEDREAIEREERGERAETVPGTVSREARARAKKQREKARAAKRARRHNRPSR